MPPIDKERFISQSALAVGCVAALAFMGAATPRASAASLSRSVDVNATPAAVWAVIGPFCAIKNWHPVIATCTEDGQTPPVRTLVTKDGRTTFVEMQTARSDTKHFYTYTFQSSPLPVTHYKSTITVVAKGNGISTVTWRGTYTPVQGKEKDASDTLTGIYTTGLDSIRAKFTK